MRKINTTIVNLILDSREEVVIVADRRGFMSETLKNEIAKDLGVYNTVQSEGWGAVSSKNCGNIVKKAIEIAERSMIGR